MRGRRPAAAVWALLLAAPLALNGAEPGPQPVDLRRHELSTRDIRDLKAAGYSLGPEGRLLYPRGPLVEEQELSPLLEELRQGRATWANMRLRSFLDLASRFQPPPADLLEELRRIFQENQDLVSEELREPVARLLAPRAAAASEPANPARGGGAAALPRGPETPLPEAAEGAPNRESQPAAQAESGGDGFDGALPRARKEPGLPQPPPFSRPTFTIPSLEYLHEMRARIEVMPYDREVKRLLRTMVLHSFEEDSRLAIETLETQQPEIRLGQELPPYASGMAHGTTSLVVRRRGRVVQRPDGSEDFVLPEDEGASPLAVLWPLIKLRRWWNEEDTEGEMARVLLHEILHIATAAEGNASSLVSELRSHLAAKRMLYLLHGREFVLSRPELRDVAGLREWLIPLYAGAFGLADMREDQVDFMRRDTLRLLALAPAEREREARREFQQWARRRAQYRRETVNGWFGLGGLIGGEEQLRQIREDLERDIRSSEAPGFYDDESHRRLLKGLLMRLDNDRALYERLLREDEAFNRRYLGG